MSWDFSLEHPEPKCPHCGKTIPWPDDGYLNCDENYTYNVSPMYYDAIGGEGIRTINGMKCSEARPILEAAAIKMASEPAKYSAMNPSNGWGNYEGALALLVKLREWAEQYPEAVFRVS